MTTPLRIEITDDARAQIAAAAGWWAENRPSAPGAVLQDLDRILGLLSVQPGMGTRARRAKLSGVRRVTLTDGPEASHHFLWPWRPAVHHDVSEQQNHAVHLATVLDSMKEANGNIPTGD